VLRNRLVAAATQDPAKVDQTAQRAAGVYDEGAEPEGLLLKPDEFHNTYHSSTVILCKDIADKLTKQYGGWQWAVQPQEFGQVINIFCPQLSMTFGYTIRMADIMDDPQRKEGYRAGGEILKRFNMPNRFDADALAAAPRDAHGQCVPDISDFANKKIIRDAEVARKLDSGEWQIVEANGHRYLKTNGTR
jgi:hypothetical protein